MMYVVGSVDENEIMLYNVILALRDSLHLLFKYVPIPSPLLPPSPLPNLYERLRQALTAPQAICRQAHHHRQLRPRLPRHRRDRRRRRHPRDGPPHHHAAGQQSASAGRGAPQGDRSQRAGDEQSRAVWEGEAGGLVEEWALDSGIMRGNIVLAFGV